MIVSDVADPAAVEREVRAALAGASTGARDPIARGRAPKSAMRALLQYGAAALLFAGPACAQFEDGNGVGFARLSGSLVGAGMACGIPKDRALVLGQRALFVAKKMQQDKSELELAQIHVAAFEDSFQRQKATSKSQCHGAIKAYKDIEDRLTLVK